MSVRTRLFLALAAVFVLGALQAYADGGVPLWTNRYTGPANTGNFGGAIAVDQNGNVFVTGGPQSNYPRTTPAVTVCYSAAGAPLWTNRYYGGGYYTSGQDIAVDGNGSVFVTGFAARDLDNGDYVTLRYSSNGVPLWLNRYHGPTNGNDGAWAMAVDASGNVFVTGGSVDRFASTEYATLAYSSAGVPLWTNVYRGSEYTTSDSYAFGIAVDDSGNVFVTGESDDAYATVAYSITGAPLWTNRYSGPVSFSTRAWAIATDKNGHVFVTGYSGDNVGNSEYATIAYSAQGVALWTNVYQGPGYDDYARAIAVDQNGNVFVMGYSAHSNVAQPVYDYAIVAYSGAGVPIWTNRYPGSGMESDAGAAVATDSSGNVFVTGSLPAVDGNSFGSAYVTIAYSGLGVPLWTNIFRRGDSPGHPQDSRAGAIAVDKDGNVLVTGGSHGTNSYSYDYLTIEYSSSGLSTAIQVSPLANFPGNQDRIVIATNNANACVALNGLVADAYPDSLTYQWFHDTNGLQFASGNPVTDCLDVGTHTIRLAVNDGHGSAGSASVTVQVVSPCSAIEFARTVVENSSLPDKRKRALLASLDAACESFDGGQPSAGLNQLNAFQNKVQAQVQDSNPVLAQTLIDSAQAIIDAFEH